MEIPKNKDSYSRFGDIEKKIRDENFYSRPDKCMLDAYISPELSRVFSRMGESPTVQGVMRLYPTNPKELFCLAKGEMYMKAFPEKLGEYQYGRYNPSLAMEILILRYLSYFRAYRISPCVQQYYMDFTCSEGNSKIEKNIYRQSLDNGWIDPRNANFQRVRYCMTEYIDGISLSEAKLTEKDMKHVLFQAFYTFDQFYLAGVRHNDPHLDNILLKKISPQTLQFVTPQGIVILEDCRYLVKIIDYDRSSFYEKQAWILEGKNYVQTSEMCDMSGWFCPTEKNPKKDQLYFFVSLMFRFKHQIEFLERFCEKVSSEPKEMFYQVNSKYRSSHPIHPCYDPSYGSKDYKFKPCKNWVPSDELFRPFSYMMEKNLFELKVLPLEENISRISMINTWISLAVNEEAYQEMKKLLK